MASGKDGRITGESFRAIGDAMVQCVSGRSHGLFCHTACVPSWGGMPAGESIPGHRVRWCTNVFFNMLFAQTGSDVQVMAGR